MIGHQLIMNWEGCGRKQSCPHLRCSLVCVSLQGLQKTTWNLSHVNQCPGWDWTRPVADLVIRSSGILRHTMYHSARHDDFWIRTRPWAGHLPNASEKALWLTPNSSVQVMSCSQHETTSFVAQKPILVSYKTGVKMEVGYTQNCG